ncbi:MAG TPA: cytochrome c oxidase assembly protein [Acetobacteraceae bacterium]|nr:cytochrome c oxidase assembly protein [Acetobacteraceae bacterium]
MPRRFRILATVFGLCLAVGVMTTLVSYSVTLYRLFCQVTGAGGYTERAASDTAARSARTVTVSFNTDVAPGMPWRFAPVQRSVTVHLGEESLVFFEAENLSDHPIVGHATFNVSPDQVGLYFKKIQCFCFTEERLGAHQKVEMPVDFFVDPRMAKDPDAADVHDIVLSYTFFESLKPKGAEDLARFDNRPPDPAAGRVLFATVCSACHELDHNKVGPMLDGVVGRRAGSVPGYPYSAALAQSGVTWEADTLDKWLAGPQHFIPGAEMPFSLPDAVRRRDVIAYLETLTPHAPKNQAAAAAKQPPG